MQQTSQHKRYPRLAVALILALASGILAASPAHAAVPPPPTVEISDGGDGFLNAAEIGAGVMVTGTYDTGAGVTKVTGRFVAEENCDLGAPLKTDPQEATINPDGTFELGPFDLSAFPEGQIVCAQARAHNADGMSDRGLSVTRPVIDTTAPAAMIDVLDDAGIIGSDLAATGVEVLYQVDEDGPDATLTVANSGDAAPAECTFAGLPRGPESVFVGPDCFAVLLDGAIDFTIAGEDLAGNLGEASAASVLDRVLSISVLADARYVNAARTGDGTAFPVLFDFPELGDTVVSAVVTVTDANGDSVVSDPKEMAATSSEETRTIALDVTALADGAVEVEGVITTDTSTHTASTSALLDLSAPLTEWTTEDGATFFRIQIPVVFRTGTANLQGMVTDPGTGSPIQFVYITGFNSDRRIRFGHTARLANRPAAETSWSLNAPLEPGEWELSAYAQDEAGNLGPAVTINVTVMGIL